MFNFNIQKVNFEEELGSGVSGTVYPYQKDPLDKKWVVKNIVTKDIKEVLMHIQEIVLGFNIEHANVLPVRGYHIDYNREERLWKIYIKLPRMKNSLRSILTEYKKENKSMPEEKIAQYFYAITQGLQYLHRRNIAHRDIKPDNTLIGEDGSIRVADFGLGHFIGGGETSYLVAEKVGALFYVAPEVQDEKSQLKKKDLLRADLWSLGMMILELCTLDLRFLDFASTGQKREADIRIKIQELEGKYSKSLLDLISGLLRSDPSQRKDLLEIQKELESRYKGILQIEKQDKENQAELIIKNESSDKRILEELQKKLEAMHLDILKIERKPQPNKPIEEEEVKLDERLPPNLQAIEILKQEFEQKWAKYYNLEMPRPDLNNPMEYSCPYSQSGKVRNSPIKILEGPVYMKAFTLKQSSYQKAQMINVLKPLAGSGILVAEGEEWKRHRRTMSLSLQFDYVKANIGLIQRTSQDFLQKISVEDCQNYPVTFKMQEIIGEIIAGIFFGQKLKEYSFEGKSLSQSLIQIISELLISEAHCPNLLFGPKIMEAPLFVSHQNIKERILKFRELCFKIVQDVKNNPLSNAEDLLSYLVQTRLFSDENIVDDFISLFISGVGPTAHLISMALYNLTQHPEFLSQLESERQKIRNNNRNQPITMDNLNHMELLASILKETLRLQPPAVVTFVQEAIQDNDLAGLKIKKGDMVVGDLLSLGYDEKRFENPRQFNPARWMDKKTAFDVFAFLPFSAGVKNCIGQFLATIVSKIIICEFLERFSFELKEGYKPRLAFTLSCDSRENLKFTLRPKIVPK